MSPPLPPSVGQQTNQAGSQQDHRARLGSGCRCHHDTTTSRRVPVEEVTCRRRGIARSINWPGFVVSVPFAQPVMRAVTLNDRAAVRGDVDCRGCGETIVSVSHIRIIRGHRARRRDRRDTVVRTWNCKSAEIAICARTGLVERQPGRLYAVRLWNMASQAVPKFSHNH